MIKPAIKPNTVHSPIHRCIEHHKKHVCHISINQFARFGKFRCVKGQVTQRVTLARSSSLDELPTMISKSPVSTR